MSTLTTFISMALTILTASAMLYALAGLPTFNDGRPSLSFWGAFRFNDMLKV